MLFSNHVSKAPRLYLYHTRFFCTSSLVQTSNEKATRANEKFLSLQISNPASLLNHISQRYVSTSRIVMEFVDNALDDAEELYRDNGDCYPYKIQIILKIDKDRKTITIEDNCRGMTPKQLETLVLNVGESTKKGVSWLNGQFGFGIHSFRAAAKYCTVISKTKGHESMGFTLSRTAMSVPVPTVWKEKINTETGSKLVLDGFEKQWWKEITALTLKKEIEQHFERLLTRPQLEILVLETVGQNVISSLCCKPFDYDSIPGSRIREQFQIKGAGKSFPVMLDMVVSYTDEASHKVRFFSKGRRINEVAHIPSFMKHSMYKKTLWGHPQLLGVIDIGNGLEPVITRDDFQRSASRAELYNVLTKFEGNIVSSSELFI
eukprot:TRINITY_DN6935_c0_g7_i3.p1 TRINITY_DN6935_c0_g7~~TRINITY_DN6935_c0_g7_i3.p1  ORF type:complete len:376 (-),score=64.72 TRINITY_DN6935_c0_g7_i3:183-1310(-)